MDSENNVHDIIGVLDEHVGRRRQQLQDDEALLKGVIDRLNLHCCSVNKDRSTVWLEREEIMNAYQKAREDRDEYKFQLNEYKMKTKQLKQELDEVRLNQAQHNISVVADVSLCNERKSCAYTVRVQPGDTRSEKNDMRGEQSTVMLDSKETYKRELNYLHKTNEQYYEQIRKLKADLASQKALTEELENYKGEITKLQKIIEEKQEKMMHMQIEFDEKLKNSKRNFMAQISALNDKNQELEKMRDALNIDLGAAHEELRILRLSLKNPVEEAAVHNNSIDFAYKAVINEERVKKETSNEKVELVNVSTRREKRSQLQPIENIINQEHPSLTSLSEQSVTEEQQVTVDEVKDLANGVTRGTKRGQRGGKGPKKESAASQKQETKKMKSSDEKNADSLQNIKNDLTDESSLDTRKGSRTRTVVNPRKKVADSVKNAAVTNNKKNKKLKVKEETDENVEPCPREYSSPSLNATFEKIKLPEGSSTPVTKLLKKVQDNNTKRTNRRKNK